MTHLQKILKNDIAQYAVFKKKLRADAVVSRLWAESLKLARPRMQKEPCSCVTHKNSTEIWTCDDEMADLTASAPVCG